MPPTTSNPNEYITVKGAREHNLKNVSLSIPKNKLVVISGVSGSGKSTLAFDTLYAEGQRKYVESLSAYARQFLETMRKPEVDSIEGLCPAISIEQKTSSRNPRSTVGTVTEIYDYLRLLFARIGIPYSPATGKPITAQSVDDIADQILQMKQGSKIMLLAPLVRDRKGEHRQMLEELASEGFVRVRINGKIYEDLADLPTLNRTSRHNIEAVVDRLVIPPQTQSQNTGESTAQTTVPNTGENPTQKASQDTAPNTAPNTAPHTERLKDSIETTLAKGNHILIVVNLTTGEERIFSSKFACPVSGFTIEELEPRLFSFNSPQGHCLKCNGLGFSEVFDENLIIPAHDLGLGEGMIAPWRNGKFRYEATPLVDALIRTLKVSEATPWQAFTKAQKQFVLRGDGKTELISSEATTRRWDGIIAVLNTQYELGGFWVKEDLGRFMTQEQCPSCGGKRLRPEALAVKVDNKDISQITELTAEECLKWVAAFAKSLSNNLKTIATPILQEVQERLTFLKKVGLGYVTLARAATTLSGGESQRIRLASQIGSGLTGVLYVLDEPSIGLHQRDNKRLLETLYHLKGLGNSVIVVEHDLDTIAAADEVIDIGPKAGVNGGEVIDQLPPAKLVQKGKGITAAYLSKRKTIEPPKNRTKPKKGYELVLEGAKGHNLKNITVRFPLGLFICVSGVSGSGKSTLVTNSLVAALAKNPKHKPCQFRALKNRHLVDETVSIDQSPIGRTPRSNPATYVGAFTPIRQWFTQLPYSRKRGWKSGRFSFNVSGGRCENCEGAGTIRIPMNFLADAYVRCDVCKGMRYNQETLKAVYRHKNISQVLDLTIDEACEFFKAVPAIKHRLTTLKDVGLGYIKLGQGAPTLSGGESQRVRLARELNRRPKGNVIYAFDEPTVGLHSEDVARLLEVFDALKAQGHTLVVIEHNLDVIKHCDWLIDLGPEGGNEGGEVVAQGTPEQVAKTHKGHTAKFL